MPAVIIKMAIPMLPAMRWVIAVDGCSWDSRKKELIFFISSLT
jgi:hypothetical protein